ncbi:MULTISPECIES: porin [Parabacteroides]|uniref:OprO/OprP family phosphate-selective porin n=1 Tax=Parabacteroides leei TaxID=2939491 RepID=UPI001897E80F|nr:MULTISPECIES: porin [Parabacteroides]MCL3854659.1 porin [Parabacteroides leei]
MKHITILLLAILYTFPLFASPDSSPVDWKLSGRLFLDGGVYIHSPKSLHAGAHISDVRLAAKVRIYSNWYTKIDIGFANNKVTMKDAFIEYGKDGNYFRAGYMLGYYSIDQSTSTNDLVFNTASNVAETFYPDRRIGLSYTRSLPSYYFSAGAFCGDGLSFSETTKPGYNFSGRIVWRPLNSSGQLFHIGTGALFRVPDKDTEAKTQQIRLKSKGVTYIPSPRTLDMTVEDAENQIQSNVECLFFQHKWLLQTEFLYTNINRKDHKPSYSAHGGYIMGGFLLKGTKYAYDALDAIPVMPEEPHSILLACRYNYTNLNDLSSNTTGGSQHDLSIGINYYFNKYISSRLNYAHLWMDKYSALGKCGINMMQLRLQVRF